MESTEPGRKLLAKEEALRECLAAYGSVVVAYSGGVDSSYLADVAHEVLGKKAHMVLFDSPCIDRAELDSAQRFAEERGWNFSTMAATQFEIDAFQSSDVERCYSCKREKFNLLSHFAEERKIAAVLHGEHIDDGGDPARATARAVRGIDTESPMFRVGLGKAEIRELSKSRGLSTWSKPSSPCLRSHFGREEPVDEEGPLRIGIAEDALRRLGFKGCRVRSHGNLCRIELPAEDMGIALDASTRQAVVRAARGAGYRHVTLDLMEPEGKAEQALD